MSRTIAIGDIHGCSQALEVVLRAIEPKPDDTIVALGDYIDRGTDSRGVVEQMLALAKQCRLVPLMGNHEIMLLDALNRGSYDSGWLLCGGKETLLSYGGGLENIPPDHIDFFRSLVPYYETDTHFFVHANYQYDMPLADQPDYLLYWEHLHLSPPRPHDGGKRAIVGHTSQKNCEILDLGHVVCLDTFCHGGGWLTALEVDSGQVWQADRFGNLRGAGVPPAGTG
jgi:calcineurin-like phosphoesterase family protein